MKDKMVEKPCRRRGQEIVRAQHRKAAAEFEEKVARGVCPYCDLEFAKTGLGTHMKFCKEKQ